MLQSPLFSNFKIFTLSVSNSSYALLPFTTLEMSNFLHFSSEHYGIVQHMAFSVCFFH